MPFIRTTTNKSISDAARENLKTKLGQAIALIPGKSESWLMLAFDDGIPMAFRGNNEDDFAYLEVNIFGSSSDAAYERLTNALCTIVNEELDIPLSNIYVKYMEAEHWGWNGSNF